MIRTPQTERAFTCLPPFGPGPTRPLSGGLFHPLDGLRGSGVADRFCAWAGRSSRRYIFSVMPLDRGTGDLPLGPGAVVLAIRRSPGAPRRSLWVARIEDETAGAMVRAAVEGLAGAGDGELHVHLLATTAAEREAVVRDLDVPRLPDAGNA